MELFWYVVEVKYYEWMTSHAMRCRHLQVVNKHYEVVIANEEVMVDELLGSFVEEV